MDDLPAPSPLHHLTLVGTRPAGLSLALAWKAARPGLTVTGLDAPEPLEAAAEAGAVDRKAASPASAVEEAGLVLLAERLPAALRRLDSLAPHLSSGTLVTDAGAAKQPIVRHAADVLPAGVSFVGGHPIAADDAPPAPDAGRFDGGTYVLCPPEAPPAERLAELVALAEATGARVEVMPAARHDRLAASARDLPDLLLSVLRDVLSEEGGDGSRHETIHALTPPALRSLIWGRAPLSDERREELVASEGPLLDALGRYVRALQKSRRHLASGELDEALGTDPPT